MTPWEFWNSGPKWDEVVREELEINYYEPGWWKRTEPGQEYAIP
jgi:hypothetical protein